MPKEIVNNTESLTNVMESTVCRIKHLNISVIAATVIFLLTLARILLVPLLLHLNQHLLNLLQHHLNLLQLRQNQLLPNQLPLNQHHLNQHLQSLLLHSQSQPLLNQHQTQINKVVLLGKWLLL